MQAQVAGQLGMKRSEQHRARRVRAPGRPSCSASTSTPAPTRSITRSPDEHAGERAAGERLDVEVGLERLPLAAVAVAAHGHVDRTERLLVGAPVDDLGASTISPAHTASAGMPSRERVAQRRAQARRVEQLVDRGRLAARQDDRVDPGELLGRLDERRRRRRARRAPRPARGTRPAARAPRLSSLSHSGRADSPRASRDTWRPHRVASGYQPRSASFTSSEPISSPRIASPSPRDTFATMSASV